MSGSKLFEANGRPLGKSHSVFALRECVERESIRKLIESNGGELRAKWTPGTVHLEPGAPKSLAVFSRPKDHIVYSLNYVKDATAQRSLPSLDGYSFRFPMAEPLETDAQREGYKGRNKFTQGEEDVMTQFMKRYPGSYTSLAYWTKALEQGIGVERTANALRDHSKRMMEGKTVAREELRKMEEAKKKAERQPLSASPKPAKKAKTAERQGSPVTVPRVPSAFTPVSPQRPLTTPSPAITHRASLTTPQVPPRATERSTGKSSQRSLLSSVSPRKLGERFETSADLVISIDSRGRSVTDFSKLKERCRKEHIFDQLSALVRRCVSNRSASQQDEREVVEVLVRKDGDVEATLAHFA